MAKQPSLAKLAARRLGPLQGGRAIAFMWQWLIWRESTGERPATMRAAVASYADWWRESERTVWRELARFREAFPGEQTPDRLLDQAQDQIERRRGARGLGNAVVAA